MTSNLELRTKATKAAVEAFEAERDKLLDQMAHFKGQVDRLEWVIRVLLAQVTQIEQDEAQLEKQRQAEEEAKKQQDELQKQQEEALTLARDTGNIGAHPAVRKANLAARKARAKEDAQQASATFSTENVSFEASNSKKKKSAP